MRLEYPLDTSMRRNIRPKSPMLLGLGLHRRFSSGHTVVFCFRFRFVDRVWVDAHVGLTDSVVPRNLRPVPMLKEDWLASVSRFR